MARVIEIDDHDTRYSGYPYGYNRPVYYEGSGFGGGMWGGTLAIIFLILLILWFGGPWLGTTAVPTPTRTGVTTTTTRPVEAVVLNPFGDTRYVIADNLNMRLRPNNYSEVSYILPRGTRVELLGVSHQETDGDLWVKVRVNTLDGLQDGWVSSQYIG
jgi:hypothetical protein